MLDLIDYPEDPQFVEPTIWNNLLHLKKNWGFSREKLVELNKLLNKAFIETTFAIAVAGSYGRMEASSESDLDFIILYESGNYSSEAIERIKEKIVAIAKSLDIALPNNTGVFSVAFSIDEIIEKIGHNDDNLNRLGQRMLLLMESRPIFNKEFYDHVIKKILQKYLDQVIKEPRKEAIFLLNDLIRYFRSIAVNYEYSFWKDNQKWVIRNVKLRHSRVLIYSGLLFMILNSSKKDGGKFDYFIDNIGLTPIEKVVSIYDDNKDSSYERVLSAYNLFIGKLNDKTIRDSLQSDYDDRYKNPHYSELKVTSDYFISELTRFILTHRSKWTPQIFEYLIF